MLYSVRLGWVILKVGCIYIYRSTSFHLAHGNDRQLQHESCSGDSVILIQALEARKRKTKTSNNRDQFGRVFFIDPFTWNFWDEMSYIERKRDRIHTWWKVDTDGIRLRNIELGFPCLCNGKCFRFLFTITYVCVLESKSHGSKSVRVRQEVSEKFKLFQWLFSCSIIIFISTSQNIRRRNIIFKR